MAALDRTILNNLQKHHNFYFLKVKNVLFRKIGYNRHKHFCSYFISLITAI